MQCKKVKHEQKCDWTGQERSAGEKYLKKIIQLKKYKNGKNWEKKLEFKIILK